MKDVQEDVIQDVVDRVLLDVLVRLKKLEDVEIVIVVVVVVLAQEDVRVDVLDHAQEDVAPV